MTTEDIVRIEFRPTTGPFKCVDCDRIVLLVLQQDSPEFGDDGYWVCVQCFFGEGPNDFVNIS